MFKKKEKRFIVRQNEDKKWNIIYNIYDKHEEDFIYWDYKSIFLAEEVCQKINKDKNPFVLYINKW